VRSITVFFAFLVACAGCTEQSPAPGGATPEYADVVYRSGSVYTVNPAQPNAQAVAIRGERITFVGSDDEVRRFIGPETRVFDLRGRLMLPAFQDAHLHPIKDALEVLACNLTEIASLDAYRAKIATCASDNRDAPWVTGSGWLMSVFGPGARTDKAILDELVPDRPVYFESADGHTAWTNSRALAIAGIDRDTPDPEGGVIDRDPETGEPVGSLQEEARYLVRKHIPAPSHEQLVAALEYVRDMLHGYGITSIHTGYSYEEYLKTYLEFDDRGNLGLRVRASLRWETTDTMDRVAELIRLRDRYSRGNLSPTCVKIFLDGVMENFTALLVDPYLTEGGSRGIPMYDQEHLNEIVTRLDAEGFQVLFHAVGDGAARQALDAVEAARTAHGDLGHRHHIVHLELVDPDDIPRFAALDVVANFSPLWAYADDYVTDLTVPFIGPERSARLYPIGSVRDAGARIAFGSDWSVSSADPFLQIETAVTRVDPGSHDTPPLNPDEALTIQEAVAAFTKGSAWVIGHEDTTGSIETGKLADLIVVDRNILEIDPRGISDARVILTLFGGRPVYGDPDALAAKP